MTPFTDYQFSVAVQKERLPKRTLTLVQPRKSTFRRRVCMCLGNWLMRVGGWLMQHAQPIEGNPNDLELA